MSSSSAYRLASKLSSKMSVCSDRDSSEQAASKLSSNSKISSNSRISSKASECGEPTHSQRAPLASDITFSLPLKQTSSLESSSAPLTVNEMKSVRSLVAFAAQNRRLQEETITSLLESHFGVIHVADLRRQHYNEAIHYLADMCDIMTHVFSNDFCEENEFQKRGNDMLATDFQNEPNTFDMQQRMANVIVGILREKGECLPRDLREKGFSREEINRYLPMAFGLAKVQLSRADA